MPAPGEGRGEGVVVRQRPAGWVQHDDVHAAIIVTMQIRAESGAPPFFVVGNDRSGTTMLRLVLDRSAEVAIPPESMFLIDFAASPRGGLDAARRRRLRRRCLAPSQSPSLGAPGDRRSCLPG